MSQTQVQSGFITDNSVTTAKIADSNVTTAKIADSNVTTAKIADSNITPSKLSTGGPNWNTAGTLTATAFSGNVTGNVTGNAGTVTNGVYTTNFTGATNQLLSANGWQKLPGGLIMQWGKFQNPTLLSNITVTFPIAFTTACYNVQISVCVDPVQDTPSGGEVALAVPLPTRTQFVSALRRDVSRAADWTYFWFAIGV